MATHKWLVVERRTRWGERGRGMLEARGELKTTRVKVNLLEDSVLRCNSGQHMGQRIYIAGPVREPLAQLMCRRWPGPGWHEREWANVGMSVTQTRGSGASRRGLVRMHEKHEGGARAEPAERASTKGKCMGERDGGKCCGIGEGCAHVGGAIYTSEAEVAHGHRGWEGKGGGPGRGRGASSYWPQTRGMNDCCASAGMTRRRTSVGVSARETERARAAQDRAHTDICVRVAEEQRRCSHARRAATRAARTGFPDGAQELGEVALDGTQGGGCALGMDDRKGGVARVEAGERQGWRGG
ncbi:hypothetical protein B0H21DRAFT_714192 [Amylocystis lapponica]|nr:hypothetical protein B0H21DRAFT_714192 [Amylocystis lapponica]